MAEDLEAQLSSMSAKELKKYAEEKGIDLGGAKQKKKIIQAILDSSQSAAAEPEAEQEPAPAEKGAEPQVDAETEKPEAESASVDEAPIPQADAEAEKPTAGTDAAPHEQSPEESVASAEENTPEAEKPEEFDPAEFEKSIQGINTELEQIGTHITSTLGKLAGIDEVTSDELRTIDETILSTSFVEVDFEEPRSHLREAKRLQDGNDWRGSFKASAEAIRGIDRQAKGFRRVAYARALEACEKSLHGLERGTEGLATAQHELLHAKLLFSRDDERRMLESLTRLDEAISSIPETAFPRSGDARAPSGSSDQAPENGSQEQPASARRGKCRNCQSTDIEFFENGTARCRGCGRMFVWRKPQRKGFFDRVFGSK